MESASASALVEIGMMWVEAAGVGGEEGGRGGEVWGAQGKEERSLRVMTTVK